MGYVAFVLDEKSRAQLLRSFPPKFPDVIAHHVTLKFGISEANAQYWIERNYPTSPIVKVVGYMAGNTVEVVAVSVNGVVDTGERTYHVTLSLDRNQGAKPKDSGIVLNTLGWCSTAPIVLTGAVVYCQ